MDNNSINRLFYRARYIVLYLLLFLMAISYHPTIVTISHNAGYENGTILSRYITGVFIILLVLCITFSFWRSSFMRFYLVLSIIAILIGIIVYASYGNSLYVNETRSILLSFFAIIIGWSLNPSKKGIENMMVFFSLCILFSGLMQVIMNIGGFVIKGQYLADAKNSLGALLGTVIISMLIVRKSTDSKMMRLVSALMAVLGFVIILTVRARGALLSTILIGSLFFFRLAKKNNNSFVVVFFLLFLALLSLPFLPDVVTGYIYDSLFAGEQGEDFSSGRVVAYYQAIDFLSQGNNIWLGDVDQSYDFAYWIHNYVLLQVFRYGLLFSFPLLVLYFYVFLKSIKGTIHTQSALMGGGYPLLMILLMISLFEPTFPFGPGTATLFNFILFGTSLRNNAFV